jgi:hypothetical protein
VNGRTRYLATINVPGYLPMSDDAAVFDSVREAWAYLSRERERGEEVSSCDDECDIGPACQWNYAADLTETYVALDALGNPDTWINEPTPGIDIPSSVDTHGIGTVYGETPGYHGDHDLGLAYSVTRAEDLTCSHCGCFVTEPHNDADHEADWQ